MRKPKKESASKYPFQENAIYCGDNLEVLSYFPAECVDLVYIDPPFFTNKQYEIIWNDGYETRSFEDRWEGGIQHYIDWMRPRIEQLHRLLKPTGSFWIHCDPHANAYLRILCDQIFGYGQIANEIIWSFGNRATVLRSGFPSKHDNIYWYTKGKTYVYNEILKEYKDKEMKRYNQIDENGKRYALIKRKRTSGEIYYGKCYPRDGVPETDVWDIPTMASTSSERLGYPTQKPEALLERIIQASSNEGHLVLDSFCGCGTAIAVAKRLKRHFIGIDISPTACKLMANRIMYPLGSIIGMPYTVAEVKALTPFEFQNWAVQKLGGRISSRKTGDMGVDGIVPLEGNLPIQVKQSENVSRPEIDKFETAIKRLKKVKGYFIAFSFTRGAVEEIARCKNQEGLEIVYLTLPDLIAKENGQEQSNK